MASASRSVRAARQPVPGVNYSARPISRPVALDVESVTAGRGSVPVAHEEVQGGCAVVPSRSGRVRKSARAADGWDGRDGLDGRNGRRGCTNG
jgi:hypothetical protein